MASDEPYFWGPATRRVDLVDAAAHLSAVDPVLGAIVERVGPVCLAPPRLAPAHYLQRSIVFQQLSGKAAATIYGRFLDLFGGRPPSPARVLATSPARLRSAGLSTAKAAAIVDLARHAKAGRIPGREALYRLPASAILDRLTAVRGVGPWTVEMLLIFYLGHADILPLGDLAIRQGFARVYRKGSAATAAMVARQGRRWRPYRSAASWYLWRSLELPPG